MVQNTGILILCFLAGHVLRVSASYNECEAKEFGKCNQVFTDVFQKADKNQNVVDIYCKALKVRVECMASNTECVGEAIDLMRFAFLQHVTLDTTLGTCTNFDLEPLRKLVHANEKYHTMIAGLKDLEKDHFQPCAAKKNVYCASRFAEELKSGAKLCHALPNFFKCYESKTLVCDDKIYKDFVVDVIRTDSELKEFVKKFPNAMPGCS
ncbi:uncharacterized protein LOC116296666 [Actinia tenebrosa]|uniref:Uncharacterized protein LOC116296666 n=1 Tax=Actinia tenebrosa TaxID=6105 RepID=A0A6P8I6D5_ACTTE|nr:uncharacterized protein LOC116296666 [Actinia tenebrosa]